MSNYSFSEEAINNAINAAKETHKDHELDASKAGFDITHGGCMLVGVECIKVVIEDNKVCIDIPYFGKKCFTLPVGIPNGTVGKACLSFCATWGIPTGVKVSIIIAGVTIISKSFGRC